MADEFSSFLERGIYVLRGANAVFVDPPRVLNGFYTSHMITSSSYYSRSLRSRVHSTHKSSGRLPKRRKSRKYELNEREISSERRHREVRDFLLQAYGAFTKENAILSFICCLTSKTLPDTINDTGNPPTEKQHELSFIDLGNSWQAPLFQVSLSYKEEKRSDNAAIAGVLRPKGSS